MFEVKIVKIDGKKVRQLQVEVSKILFDMAKPGLDAHFGGTYSERKLVLGAAMNLFSTSKKLYATVLLKYEGNTKLFVVKDGLVRDCCASVCCYLGEQIQTQKPLLGVF